MSIGDVGKQSFDPNTIGLPQPKSIGEEYLNTVTRVKGQQLGEGDNAIGANVGNAAIQDVLEQIKASDVKVPLELQNVLLAFNIQTARFIAQQQINSLDPANPTVPLLQKYVELTFRLELSAGDLVAALGTQGAQTVALDQKIVTQGDASSDANIQARAAVRAAAAGSDPTSQLATAAPLKSGSSGGNPWFQANAYTAFLVYYTEMLRALKDMKRIDGETQIVALNMMVELAKDSAKAIMDAAETRFWKHIAMAIVDAVSIAVTIGCTVGSMVGSFKQKPEVDTPATGTAKPQSAAQIKVTNLRWQTMTTGFDAFRQSAGSAEKAANNMIEGFMELEAAQYDAKKEMLQAYRTMSQMQADRALDSFKQDTDMIAQLIQQIDQMRSKILEAQAKALSRSS